MRGKVEGYPLHPSKSGHLRSPLPLAQNEGQYFYHLPLLYNDAGELITGLLRCSRCGLSETYWDRFPCHIHHYTTVKPRNVTWQALIALFITVANAIGRWLIERFYQVLFFIDYFRRKRTARRLRERL